MSLYSSKNTQRMNFKTTKLNLPLTKILNGNHNSNLPYSTGFIGLDNDYIILRYTPKFCFISRKSFLLYSFFDLQQADKIYLCKQRWNIHFFLSTWSFQNLAYPAGSPMNLMAYCDQITTSYTNHCFNFFSLFSNYLCLVSFSAVFY